VFAGHDILQTAQSTSEHSASVKESQLFPQNKISGSGSGSLSLSHLQALHGSKFHGSMYWELEGHDCLQTSQSTSAQKSSSRDAQSLPHVKSVGSGLGSTSASHLHIASGSSVGGLNMVSVGHDILQTAQSTLEHSSLDKDSQVFPKV